MSAGDAESLWLERWVLDAVEDYDLAAIYAADTAADGADYKKARKALVDALRPWEGSAQRKKLEAVVEKYKDRWNL